MALSRLGVGRTLAIVALVLSVIAVLLALVLGAATVALPLSFALRGRSVPMIHDITTDTDDPPLFEAVLPARGPDANPAVYEGRAVAAQQRQAYPDLHGLVRRDSPAQAFDRALATARALGWTIVDADPARHRIEATDTTFWFGFKDDVVIRIRPDGAGSRVDVRSLSRVGRSDVGTNARRIRRFLDALQKS